MVGSKRKYKIIFIFLILIMTLTSCDYHVNTHLVAIDLSKEVVKSLSDKNKDALKSIFSNKAKKRKEFDDEIDTALNFFDGAVIDDNWNSLEGDGAAVDDGEITYVTIYPYIENIKTDTGKIYTISGFYYAKNRKEPDNVGLVAMTIYELTDEDDHDHSDNPQVTIGKYEY